MFFQIWGGTLYLFNKFFFCVAERTQKRRFKIWAWAVYCVGLPAWVFIFITDHDWMLLATEVGGFPAMLLGLINAIKGVGNSPKWLKHFALASSLFGVAYSIYYFGGFNQANQYFEFIAVVGFLLGTYLIAVEQPSGYLFFIMMNGATAFLMFNQKNYYLAVQQVLSVIFVSDAYRTIHGRSKDGPGG